MAFKTTPFHGKTARVEKNNVAMSFSNGWEITFESEFGDTTSQGDTFEDQIAGVSRWSGSFSGFLVLGNTEQKAFVDNILAGTGVKLTDVKFLLDTSSNAFTGDIHIQNFNPTAAIGDTVAFTFSFKGSGAPAVTDAA